MKGIDEGCVEDVEPKDGCYPTGSRYAYPSNCPRPMAQQHPMGRNINGCIPDDPYILL